MKSRGPTSPLSLAQLIEKASGITAIEKLRSPAVEQLVRYEKQQQTMLDHALGAASAFKMTWQSAAQTALAAEAAVLAFQPSAAKAILAAEAALRAFQPTAAKAALAAEAMANALQPTVAYAALAAEAARSLSASTEISRIAASLVASNDFAASASAFMETLALSSSFASALESEQVRQLLERMPNEGQDAEQNPVAARGLEYLSAQEDFVWNEWLKQQPPAVQLFLAFIVLFILMPAMTGFVQGKVSQWLSTEDTIAQQAVLSDIRQHLGEEHSALRCVRTRKLNVREAPGTDALVVGGMTQGQAVEVVETRGPWSLVRYRDRASGVVTQGWAASSFLVRPAC